MAEENPYAAPQVSTTHQMGSLKTGGMGNLGQEARLKQLRTARWIMIVIGVLCIVGNLVAYNLFQEEVRKLRGNVDQDAVRLVQFLLYGSMAIGAILVVLGIFVYQFPVPITLTGLILYLVIAFGPAIIDPDTLKQGIILKILIIVGLFKAFQAAQAYERQRAAEAGGF